MFPDLSSTSLLKVSTYSFHIFGSVFIPFHFDHLPFFFFIFACRLKRLSSFLVVWSLLRLVTVSLLHHCFLLKKIRSKQSRVLLWQSPRRIISMVHSLLLTLFPVLVLRWKYPSGLHSFVKLLSWRRVPRISTRRSFGTLQSFLPPMCVSSLSNLSLILLFIHVLVFSLFSTMGMASQ